MLDDLKSAKQANHFLGAIILKKSASESVLGSQSVQVIDGQQRLTTLSLLLLALHAKAADKLTAKYLKDMLLSSLDIPEPGVDPTLTAKIIPSFPDKKVYETLMSTENIAALYRKEAPTMFPNAKDHLIHECYDFFCKKLESWTSKEAFDLCFQLLYSSNNKILVVMELEQGDEEQAIFDSINSTGMHLSSADIIKNKLFDKLRKITKNDKATEEFYKETWQRTFLDSESAVAWDSKVVRGRQEFSHIDILFHAVAVAEGIYSATGATLKELSNKYEEYLDGELDPPKSFKTEKEIKGFINLICASHPHHSYATCYAENFLDISDKDAYYFSDAKKRLIHILDKLDISTLNPLVLYILMYEKDEAEQGRLFLEIESFVVRRAIVGEESKEYNKRCPDFIKAVQKKESLFTRKDDVPTDEEITIGLSALKNNKGARIATILLFWIELKRRFDLSPCDSHKQPLHYAFNLEHIMPKKYETHWGVAPELVANREDKIHWLGNMTLMMPKANSAISNKDFTIKVDGNDKKKSAMGYRDCAGLLITTDDLVQPYNTSAEGKIWDEARIEARTAKLAEKVLAIWPKY